VSEVVLSLESEHLSPVLVLEPRSVPKLDSELIPFQDLCAARDMSQVGTPIEEPWRELKQNRTELARIAYRFKGQPEAPPHLVHELRREVAVIDILLLCERS